MTVAVLPQPRALSAPASPVAEFARGRAAAGPPSELDCRARALEPLGQHAGQVPRQAGSELEIHMGKVYRGVLLGVSSVEE